MSLIKRIKRALKNPTLFLREFNRVYHTRLWTRPYNTEGVDIFEEDWDNLIILDACRYDLFKKKVDVSKYDEFTGKISRGSNSYEFVLGNFFDKELTDTAYLTGNGHIMWMKNELENELNIHSVEMFDLSEKGQKYGTHMPEDVRKKSEELLEDYEDKRIVIHFMQPHFPFLDEEERFGFKISNFWDKVYQGEIEGSYEEFWEAYSETFEKAWKEVKELIEELDGKTVITADHGNVFGERVSPVPVKEWGHPQGIYDEKLVKVPWLIIEGDERREIVKESPKDSEDYDEEEIKNQLANLGYGE